MTVQELYTQIGGDYEAAKRIMMMDPLIARMIVQFPDDTSCQKMLAAAETMDPAGLFEGSHALKGVGGNLGLTSLSRAAAEIADEFRPGNPRRMTDEEVRAKLEEIRKMYDTTIEGIRAFSQA